MTQPPTRRPAAPTERESPLSKPVARLSPQGAARATASASRAGDASEDTSRRDAVTEQETGEIAAASKAEEAADASQATRQRRRAEPLLVECSWEVCNQLGGIYTVIRSKVPSMVGRWGNRYCLLGPYNEATASVEFEAGPLTGPFGQAAKALRDEGVRLHYGRWLVTGRPLVVLFETDSARSYLYDIKARLYRDHAIPTPEDNALIDGCVLFGELVRRYLRHLGGREADRRDIVGHFHEWMAGVPIPMLRREGFPGGMVFTTHATLLGRYLAMHNPAFYDHLPFFSPEQEATHFNVRAQHGIEAAAAHGSHVFTTVSDVTAEECRYLLRRPADVLLPNGLNIQRFAALHEFQNLHVKYKEQLHRFTMAQFFPSYSFDLDQTRYFFTSGRYEFLNKGMDLTLESLARLNWRLKDAGTPVTVVFFLITRAPYRSLNVDALHSLAMLNEFGTAAEAITEHLREQLVLAATEGRMPDLNELVDDYWRLRLRRTIHAWRRHRLPAIVTHDLHDDSRDPILEKLRQCQLINHRDDPVKVVYHPDFITPTNPLFGLDYDQFVRGCHLGIFPSYYEPWGYTPLESIALGVPAITSDLSGFGSYLNQLLPDHDEQGLFVVHRRHKGFDAAAEELTDQLFRFCQLNRRERIALRNSVEAFSTHFDWHNLARRYHEAHELAIDRVKE